MGNSCVQRCQTSCSKLFDQWHLTTPSKTPNKIDDDKSAIKYFNLQILTFNNCNNYLQIDENLTVLNLKKQIYNHIDDILTPDFMSLFIGQQQLENHAYVSNYTHDRQVLITQKKSPITKIKGLTNFIYDDINCQMAAKMPCNHHIGSAGVIQLIKSIINRFQYEIRCPTCGSIWDFNLCKKVGVMTKSQQIQFKEKLEDIKFIKNSTECMQCESLIHKPNVGNRVHCPNQICFSDYFCYKCHGKWKNSHNIYDCGNKGCELDGQSLLNLQPNGKILQLRANSSTYFLNEYFLPIFRACPNCGTIIQHIKSCKHMNCPQCQTDFCWICLQIKPKHKEWPCGQQYQVYCGKTAGIQNYQQLKKKRRY